MGNNCSKNNANHFLILKGGYPLTTPQKQNSLEQFTYDMKLNLDSFEDEFFQKEYKINPSVQDELSKTQKQDLLDFVIESPTSQSQNLKNYFVQRNYSAPPQKGKRRPYAKMNGSKYIVYEISEHANQKKIKPSSRSLPKTKQLSSIQKIEENKPRKHHSKKSKCPIKHLVSQSKTQQTIDGQSQKRISAWRFNDAVKILF
ncbi:unnamed protein product (macronuclear) [Paramecium tetraurelia]|uniref:Uncharacterized protein n=1 Tax=Paramecium tetraurelia TaxID=5888 RepID=A0DVV3_PARTE|nr:uncharacterized protein GSPATT00020823001 [Paramecium tetraurelia]CAK87170.1 unnamed protein product [Paramecium tetraurelia]|eukprot:XP_001454567.1 hypothetical protein (macronuclear) [Paramecium tetraurelia strain d4-2]